MNNRIDHMGNVALRKIGNPKSFSVCGWTACDDGSVTVRMKAEAPRDDQGRRHWTGDEKTASVTPEDEVAEMMRFESETGRCAKCDGTGQQWQGWSARDGDRHGPCSRCNATGKAKGQ